jgi:hypothetical protein
MAALPATPRFVQLLASSMSFRDRHFNTLAAWRALSKTGHNDPPGRGWETRLFPQAADRLAARFPHALSAPHMARPTTPPRLSVIGHRPLIARQSGATLCLSCRIRHMPFPAPKALKCGTYGETSCPVRGQSQSLGSRVGYADGPIASSRRGRSAFDMVCVLKCGLGSRPEGDER